MNSPTVLLLVLAALGQTSASSAVNVCGCFCSNDGVSTSIDNLVGGFETSSGASVCTVASCNTNYAASTQCSSASFNYVIAQYEAGVVPDATLNIAQVSNCGGAVTVGGTDCNSACLAGFSLGNIATGVNLLIPTNTNSTCACAVGEIITTSATNSAGAGTGILITPAPTDPNIEFSWNAATINGLSGFTMTAGTGAFTGCTISYSLSAPSSSPAANIVKPAAALVAAGVVAMLL